jgi:surface polysaccharide O-acyltransferase-like enzyme
MKEDIMLDNDELQSKTIDLLRFPLTVAVVYIHMLPQIDMNDFKLNGISDEGLYSLFGLWGSNILASIAVPTFFFFSGFLFFNNKESWSKQVFYRKILKRVRTLFLPYILWNIIAVLCSLVPLFFKSKMLFHDSLGIFGWPEVLRVFWNFHNWRGATNFINASPLILSAPFNVPFWFVRDLLVGVFLSPLIYFCITKFRYLYVIFLGLLYVINFDTNIPGLSCTMLFFFSLGGIFSLGKENFLSIFKCVRYVSYGISCLLFFILTIYHDSFVYDILLPFFVCSGMISIVTITSLVIDKRLVRNSHFLSESSFFVFSIHLILILKYSEKICDVLKLQHYIGKTGVYLVTPIICISVCLSLFCVLKKYFSGVLLLLTGERIK